MDRATNEPEMAAVRVPPSACNTSQSIQMVREPSFFQVEGGAHGTTDEALNFLGAAVDFPLRAVARFALKRGVGEHGILRCDPAADDALFLHPARDAFLDGDAANHARIAPFDERGAGGVGGDAVLEAQRAQLSGRATIGAESGTGGLRFCHNGGDGKRGGREEKINLTAETRSSAFLSSSPRLRG